MDQFIEVPLDAQAKLGKLPPGPRIQVAKAAVKEAIGKLDTRARFNVVFFSTLVRPWQKTLVGAAQGTKDQALSAIGAAALEDETNIFGALRAAVGLHEKSTLSADLDPIPDTIYFLTDGTPTRGEITEMDTILSWMRDVNRFAKVDLHVIAMGNVGVDLRFLRRASPSENGGEFIHVPDSEGVKPPPAPPAPPAPPGRDGLEVGGGPRAARIGGRRCGPGPALGGATGATAPFREREFREPSPRGGYLMRMPSILESAPESEALRGRRVGRTPRRRPCASPVRTPPPHPHALLRRHPRRLHRDPLGRVQLARPVDLPRPLRAPHVRDHGRLPPPTSRTARYATSRVFRFFLAVLGTLALQKGPLWWASAHRQHHRALRHSRGPPLAGPARLLVGARGLDPRASDHSGTDYERIKDFAEVPRAALARPRALHRPGPPRLGPVRARRPLGVTRPEWGTSGPQMLVWGVAVSTVLLYHGTWSVNSILHMWGRRRYKTQDASRNNLWVALYTFGEGWHNNHHRFQASEKQGFFWWQIDVSHMVLWLFSRVGLVWDLKRPPATILEEGRYNL